ncbi:HD domain-containing protein [Allopseudospirillum japonicum]|uniref:HD domain-containing protein n=1 Tax=Allopseudospirillum japonicum TaxID=64971 RepID=A0A1H6QE86_9GAMM|nr:HD domain-containing phosphohydrolase [Allopseudospirillum japonicum]SEI37555.1 HD domain-containing protein [Allopseudospirillum japonicum]
MLMDDDYELQPLEEGELKVGDTLPWSVFTSLGKILMKEGTKIDSPRKLSMLMNTGFRPKPKQVSPAEQQALDEASLPQPVVYERQTNPFTELDELLHELSELFKLLNADEVKAQVFMKRCYLLVTQIQGLCRLNDDALLGAVHLNSDHAYTLQHPMHVAIVCALIARKLKIPQKIQLSMLAAALTQNVAMNPYQLQLNRQRKPLNEAQRQVVNKHPEQGVALLKQVGVTDELWLDIVLQHHEKQDGTGYPQGLSGKQIRPEAKIIALADVYSAMISCRPYRPGLSAQQSLRSIFLERGSQFDEKLTMVFLNELGVYPPGACVKLKNEEIGIVIKRTQDSRAPIVSIVKDPGGELYLRPRERDTSEPEFAISATLSKQNVPTLNPTLLWGIKLMRIG